MNYKLVKKSFNVNTILLQIELSDLQLQKLLIKSNFQVPYFQLKKEKGEFAKRVAYSSVGKR